MRAHFILPLLLSVVAMAQRAGTFIATGTMTMARYGATATLLPTGKVLIAGGFTDKSVLSTLSVELYDPSIGTFTATADMTATRAYHTATLLPDGRVLMAGGTKVWDGWPLRATRSAELYDPTTETFTATGDMVSENFEPAIAVLLADGKVVIVHDGVTELYDPVTGTFSARPSPGDFVAGALLVNGRVLFATNWNAQLYDPSSGTFWVTGAPIPTIYEYGFATAPLANGKVLLAGGYSDAANIYSTGAELYDPSTGAFVPTGDMTTGQSYHTATPLGDGTVLIAGNDGTPASTTAEIYNPVTRMFSQTGNMVASRAFGHTATLLPDGTVLIAGGIGNNSGSAELYEPSVPVHAPVLFSLSGEGQGPGAIWHAATGQVTSANNPAIAGEVLAMYTTSLVQGGMVPPQVATGGLLAEILFFGEPPVYPGYYQVNFRVPSGIAPGSAVPVRLTYLGRSSNEVTVAIH